MSKRVIGWKVWCADPQNGVQRFAGRGIGRGVPDFAALAAAWARLPDSVQVVMLYEDEFSQDGTTRYRRIEQGNDRYWVAPGIADAIYGQGNEDDAEVRRRYPGAIVKEGRWIDTETYVAIVDEAMNDYEVP